MSTFADKRNEQMEKNQEFDKNLSHNLLKITEMNEQNRKTYNNFLSKINARLDSRTRPIFETSEKKFLQVSEQFLLAKYGAVNLQNNPLRGLCYVQEQESWRAYRIKFLGEMIDTKTGFLSPCHQSQNNAEDFAAKNVQLLNLLAENKTTFHHHLLEYLDQVDLFLKSFETVSPTCLQKQKHITLEFYLVSVKEWEKQIQAKHLCLQK
jgi:hypothetical protein